MKLWVKLKKMMMIGLNMLKVTQRLYSIQIYFPLNKPLKFYSMTVTITCVFSEDNKLYPQEFLDEALYSL